MLSVCVVCLCLFSVGFEFSQVCDYALFVLRLLSVMLGMTGEQCSGTGSAMGGRKLLRCRFLLGQNRYHIVCSFLSRLFCWNGYDLVRRRCCLLLVLAVAAVAGARCCRLCAYCSCSLVLLLCVRVVAGSGGWQVLITRCSGVLTIHFFDKFIEVVGGRNP